MEISRGIGVRLLRLHVGVLWSLLWRVGECWWVWIDWDEVSRSGIGIVCLFAAINTDGHATAETDAGAASDEDECHGPDDFGFEDFDGFGQA